MYLHAVVCVCVCVCVHAHVAVLIMVQDVPSCSVCGWVHVLIMVQDVARNTDLYRPPHLHG